MALKAVILCAGKSTRTYPLTLTKPKPLLKVANKPILQHNLEQLKGIVKEVILIVGYKKDMIKKQFGNKFGNIKLTYVEQKQQLGTGHALLQAKSLLDDRFIVMGGDDIFSKDDIKSLRKHKYAICVKKVDNPSQYGIVVPSGVNVKKLVEKPKRFVGSMANIGLYMLNKDIFDIKLKKSKRGEIEITDYIIALVNNKEKVRCLRSRTWQPITFPWDILVANELLLKNIKKKIQGKKEKNVTIKGKVIIGKGTVIKAGTYIEGPVVIGEKCVIGPRAYIRPSTAIGNKSKIGTEVEIKNCVIGENSAVPHISYIGDSVIGDNVNVGAGTVTGNLRHDSGIIRSSVKDLLVSTGRNKFGVIIGDGAKLGIMTVLYPGRKIWPNKGTKPGEQVKKDII